MVDESWQARWGRRVQTVLGVLLVLGGGRGLLVSAGEGDTGGMLIYWLVTTVGAFFLAPMIAERVADPVVRFLYGGKRGSLKPDLSIPQAHRKFERYEEALETLEAIVAETPDHLDAWVEMVDIALSDLGDHERARLALHRGLKSLSDPEERTLLKQAFRTLSEKASRRVAAPSAESPQVLEFPDDLD